MLSQSRGFAGRTADDDTRSPRFDMKIEQLGPALFIDGSIDAHRGDDGDEAA